VNKSAATWQLAQVPAFYDHAGVIEAFAANARPLIAQHQPDHVLFSFHGLPERHVKKADPSGAHCLASDSCCDRIDEVNQNCYRAQCMATARALRERLGLTADNSTACFQSRLGRTPWIGPYTDVVITELAARGARRLVVLCPAFVADCLETLEEIALRNREAFQAAGGEDLILVPSLNAGDAWADCVVELARGARPW